MDLHHIRFGTGRPLLLIHGIGGSNRSWQLVVPKLAAAGREVIAIDLPGHGQTPPLPGENSIRTLADAVTSFLRQHDLLGIDAVGSSMGARLVLELARRGGVLGSVVSLDPGGFWQGWEIPVFYYSVAGSVRLVRALQPVMPQITASRLGRTALFAQFSARPWAVDPRLAREEMHSFANTPNFDELLDNLAHGEPQQGAPAGSIHAPLLIGWGKRDLVCLPRQAERAVAAFPDAKLHWIPGCGHFPQWDRPKQTAALILAATSTPEEAAARLKDETRFAKPLLWTSAALALGLAVATANILLRPSD